MKWITDRLPENDDTVLGWDADSNKCVFVYYYNHTWYIDIEGNNRPQNIAAWMPLPKYKEEQSNE